jgi:hypothetical protein
MLKIKVVKKGSTSVKPGASCPFVVDTPPDVSRG